VLSVILICVILVLCLWPENSDHELIAIAHVLAEGRLVEAAVIVAALPPEQATALVDELPGEERAELLASLQGIALGLVREHRHVARAQGLARWLVERCERSPASLVFLGHIFEESSRAEAAAQCYEEALSVEVDTAAAIEGLLRIRWNDPDALLELSDRTSQCGDDAVCLFIRLAELLEGHGRYDQAILVYERAIAAQPDYALAVTRHGQLESYRQSLMTTNDAPMEPIVLSADESLVFSASADTASIIDATEGGSKIAACEPEMALKYLEDVWVGMTCEQLVEWAGEPDQRISKGPVHACLAFMPKTERWNYIDNSGNSGFIVTVSDGKVVAVGPFKRSKKKPWKRRKRGG